MKKLKFILITIGAMLLVYYAMLIPKLIVRMIAIKDSRAHADWFEARIPEELVVNADYIYEGKVVKISFDTLNMATAQPMKYSSDSDNVDFYTIYDIEVTKVYKGDVSSKAVIKCLGGIEGEKEFEQKLVLANSNMPYRTVVSGKADIKEGESYLFFTKKGVTEKQNNYTLTQFALSVKEDDSHLVNYSAVKEYLMSERYNNPKGVPTKIIENNNELMHSPEEIFADVAYYESLKNTTIPIYEGTVWRIDFYYSSTQICTQYKIIVDKVYKAYEGDVMELTSIYVDGWIPDYRVDDQNRLLNYLGKEERPVFDVANGVQVLEVGKKYLFIGEIDRIINPTQFAFCVDDSNAPGGVTYSMIMEYLENK